MMYSTTADDEVQVSHATNPFPIDLDFHKTLDGLPSTSFIPFSVSRLSSARLVWRNSAIARDVDLSSFDYCLPHVADRDTVYRNEWRTFNAERYGGQRIVNNGGGVRCAIR
ncbi:hypothetical protein [Solimicrobium silvestre]|uniref:Uncharacterized protein n=1 Tax=Solimicrobium silvestre TaxID=2099400 RepID=A0A2S9GXN3_9BURK|nr:hypothetical protein [Solimicrobium silvestre]PRC92482.1 hypothetical protein S2091_2857 [Solimicrobium silvestre]